MPRARPPVHVEVDPIACDAHGLCAEILPEVIDLDDWGYPIVRGDRITRRLERFANAAVSACPTLALRIVRDDS
jgi:ferredoxin